MLPPAQRAAWTRLHTVPSNFVLYGGTAIALRLGHRQSVDFDFFSNDPFTPAELLGALRLPDDAERLQSEPNTLTVLAPGDRPVKLSFFGGLKLRRAGVPDRAADTGIAIASLLDLAATKMLTVQDRAERKDYLDVAALLDAGVTLEASLGAAVAIYGPAFNPAITLKALTYFEDGDLPALPEPVKQRLARAAAAIETLVETVAVSDRLTPAMD